MTTQTDIDGLITIAERDFGRGTGTTPQLIRDLAQALAALRDERDRYKKSSEYYCEQYNRVADADNAAQARAEQAEAIVRAAEEETEAEDIYAAANLRELQHLRVALGEKTNARRAAVQAHRDAALKAEEQQK